MLRRKWEYCMLVDASKTLTRISGNSIPWMCLFFLFSCVGCCFDGPSCATQPVPSFCDHHIRSDHRNFYSQKSLTVAAEVFAAGALLANTDADEEIRGWYQDDVRSGTTDDIAVKAKLFGEGHLILPALGIALAAGELMDHQPCVSGVGDWADQSLRAFVVGTPPMLATQMLTGASRPTESSAESDWVPLHDNNGVSGHSFMGAVPFITAAKMAEDPWAKAGWYAASAMPAWSRVNDDAHYTSQAILGWSVAYLACSAVSDTEQELKDYRFTTVPVSNGVGVGVVFER